MNHIIETHAHIYDEQFETDREAMLQRAKDVGVSQIWMPNCNHETIESMMQLELKHPGFCVPMMGLHPCYVDQNYQIELEIITNWLEKRPFIMIGEIGIDFYWDLSFIKHQEKAFISQLEMAKKHNLPICIHSRNSKDGQMNAIQHCCDLIENFGWKDLRGIFHCFSGNLQDAQRVINLNFHLGIGGVLTFKNGGLDKFLDQIPFDKIVLETDSPYLAPVPHRGKRNEVSFLELVIEKISDIKKINNNEVILQTTKNALSIINNSKI